jgi:hypothetical protein
MLAKDAKFCTLAVGRDKPGPKKAVLSKIGMMTARG